jgi:hypothetical protein
LLPAPNRDLGEEIIQWRAQLSQGGHCGTKILFCQGVVHGGADRVDSGAQVAFGLLLQQRGADRLVERAVFFLFDAEDVGRTAMPGQQVAPVR